MRCCCALCWTSVLHTQTVDEIAVYTDIPAMASVQDANKPLDKPRVVVLGSGWAAASFLKALPTSVKCVFFGVVCLVCDA